MDFVERGFNRFCSANGVGDVRNTWEGDIVIMDHMFESTERERHEAQAERDGPPQTLFVVAEFTAAASIPIAPALAHLEREHAELPVAFYTAFVHLLWKWMRVYDYNSAHEHAEMCLIDADEEHLPDSAYPKVNSEIPSCLTSPSVNLAGPAASSLGINFPNKLRKMRPECAFALLKQHQAKLRSSGSRQLVGHLLEMQKHSLRRSHAWPHKLESRIPGLAEYLGDADGLGPGCILNWFEDDAIAACFDEEMSYMGQNGPLEPSILLAINLRQSKDRLDRQVRHVLEYVGAMLRSLAAAAKIVELIRELYHEHLRDHRIQSGLQTQPCAPGVREEQL